jgi:MFS family permease
MLSCILFGFSQNLAVAIVARSLNGLINGNLPVAKTYLGEVTDKTNQAQSYTIFAMSWGIGIVLGPVIGGLLAMPTTKYHWPSWFMKSTLEKYPFLLCNLATAFFYFVTFVLCFFFMTETVQKKPQTSSIFRSVYTSFISIVTNKTPMLASAFFAIHCFMVIIFVEVFPLWAITPHSQAGLSFGTNEIGLILSVGGAFGVAVQILTFKPLTTKITYKQLLMYYVLGMAVLMVLIVEVQRLYHHRVIFWIALAFCICLNQQLMLGTFSAFNIVMNNSVPFTLMGSMNGVAMSLAALGRTVGPTAGANLYAWSVGESHIYIISFRLVFYLIALLYVINVFCATKFLPETVNVPYAVSHPQTTNLDVKK